MNIFLKRIVRTAVSEQYTLYDNDLRDPEGDPETVGKLEIHFADETVFGTVLLWQEYTSNLTPDQISDLIDSLLEDVTAPFGAPEDYHIEFFSPSIESYRLFESFGGYDEDDDDDDDDDESPLHSHERLN